MRHAFVAQQFPSFHPPHTDAFRTRVTIGRVKTLVHLSDLHVGRDAQTKRRVRALSHTVGAAGVDHVAVSGNLTWAGRQGELASFRRIFGSLESTNRLTVVPGNHDRLGDDLGGAIQPGPRVSAVAGDGLYVVRFDSTGSEYATIPRARGRLLDQDVEAIADAVTNAPIRALVVLLLHHPVLALLPEHAPERLLSWLGHNFEEEVTRGQRLIKTLRGGCDLILHGQGSTPGATTPFAGDDRPLLVFAAGNSAELGRARVFSHEGGRLVGPPVWLVAPASPTDRPGTVPVRPRQAHRDFASRPAG